MYREKAMFLFFPFLGMFGLNYIAYFFTNDFFYLDKYIARKYPNVKIIVTNLFLDSGVIILDPSLMRELNLRQNEV